MRVKGLAEFSRDEASIFVANEWNPWDGADLDFGSSSPAFVPWRSATWPSPGGSPVDRRAG